MSPTAHMEISRGSSATISKWSPQLVPGPYWGSFEQLRTGGNVALDSIKPGSVATLRGKSGTFRILLDEDFQKLLGLASEVHRLRGGITLMVQAARVVAKHRDEESIKLLFQSVSMLSESRLLPERDGHEQFEITAEEKAENAEPDLDLKPSDIHRPAL